MLDLKKIKGLKKQDVAKLVDIETVEHQLNTVLPKEYKELLNITNGFRTSKGIFVYGTEDLVERNNTLEVQKYANGYLAIGDDSGDSVFLISLNNEKRDVLIVDCGDMSLNYSIKVASSLEEWIKNGCNLN